MAMADRRGRRQAIVDAYNQAARRLGEADPDDWQSPGLQRLRDGMTNVRAEYRAGLPRVPVSRDPFSGEELAWEIDVVDLDGPWWECENPARNWVEGDPAGLFAITGAVELPDEVTPAPWLAFPGPSVPFVIPRILEHDDIRAVISYLEVGGHAAWAITYWGEPLPYDLLRVDTWGAKLHWFTDAQGLQKWNEHTPEFDEPDFDLAPWIEAGKLSWIGPGDTSLALETSLAGCPYLELEGSRAFARVWDGKVTRWEDD